MNILLTGGRGSLGRLLVPHLREHDVWVGTRTPREGHQVLFDLASDESIDASVRGRDVIIHLATDPFRGVVERRGSVRLFDAAVKAGVHHILYVSIVGIDDHPYPYYRTKLAVERSLVESGAPYSILRTTQFHSLVPRMVDELLRLPVVPVPTRVQLQPIDPDLVAGRVVELIEAGPSGRVPDMAGTEVLDLTSMVRSYLASTGRRRIILPLPLRGGAIEAFRRGDVLSDHHTPGGATYGAFLAASTPE